MKRYDFEKLLARLQEDEFEINKTKGREYASGDEDALLNFKEIGGLLGLPPEQICMVYMFKHFKALCRYAKIGYSESNEDVGGRVADLRLYAALFLGLVQEESLVAPASPPGSAHTMAELRKE